MQTTDQATRLLERRAAAGDAGAALRLRAATDRANGQSPDSDEPQGPDELDSVNPLAALTDGPYDHVETPIVSSYGGVYWNAEQSRHYGPGIEPADVSVAVKRVGIPYSQASHYQTCLVSESNAHTLAENHAGCACFETGHYIVRRSMCECRCDCEPNESEHAEDCELSDDPWRCERELAESVCSLADYPILDDDDHSQRQCAHEDECWSDYGRGDFREALEAAGYVGRVDDSQLDALRFRCHEETQEYGETGDDPTWPLDGWAEHLAAYPTADAVERCSHGAPVGSYCYGCR